MKHKTSLTSTSSASSNCCGKDCEKNNCNETCLCFASSEICKLCEPINSCLARPFDNPSLRMLPHKQHVLGIGTKAIGNISKNTNVGEYAGEIIKKKEAIKRMKSYIVNKEQCCIICVDGTYIDGLYGNQCSYINHHCEPNVELKKWKDIDGSIRIALMTIEDIEDGQFFGIDYGYNNKNLKCFCTSERCKKHM